MRIGIFARTFGAGAELGAPDALADDAEYVAFVDMGEVGPFYIAQHMVTLAQWRASTAEDLNSAIAVPADLFVSVETGDYHLRPTSPARDAGV